MIKDTHQQTAGQQQARESAFTGAGAAAGAAPGPEPSQGYAPGISPMSNLFNTGLFAAPIPRSLGSEYMNKLQQALDKVYQRATPDTKIQILAMDAAENNFAFSCLVVCLQSKAMPSLGVAYHILVIEATGNPISPIVENIDNAPTEITRVPWDALDQILRDQVKARVQREFPGVPPYYVDGCVVPRLFNVDDENAVYGLALNAGLADSTELTSHMEGFRDINLSLAGAEQRNLVINIGFQRQTLQNAVQEPVRSDILINFGSVARSRERVQSLNSGEREEKYTALAGFIDLVWFPVANPMQPYNAYLPAQFIATQKYLPRFVISAIDSNFAYTPGAILLALVTAMGLHQSNNWVQAFRPVATPPGEIDLSDLGALNIEANLTNQPGGYGERIDTKAANFTLADLGQLVSALIRPEFSVSIDVPEAGPQTWFTSIFAAAANGKDRAKQAIYRAADELTNGAFAKYFNFQQDAMFENIDRVHLGYWTDRQGHRRDLRDIDYLAVANLIGEREPRYIRDWSDTFTRLQYRLETRLAARKKMIVGLTNETAVFTGFADRVTPSGKFMAALTQGCTDAGLVVNINTPLSAAEFTDQRGVGSFMAGGLIEPGQLMRQRATGFTGQPMGGWGGSQYRWF
jgi:hypothetical protein